MSFVNKIISRSASVLLDIYNSKCSNHNLTDKQLKMTREDKRFAAIEMAKRGCSVIDIVNEFGYSKSSARKIFSVVNFSTDPGHTFHTDTVIKPNVEPYEWSKNENHYGRGGSHEKYKVEDLRGSELTLYKKLVRADIKKQFKND